MSQSMLSDQAFFFFFCSETQTQDLALARQVLCSWAKSLDQIWLFSITEAGCIYPAEWRVKWSAEPPSWNISSTTVHVGEDTAELQVLKLIELTARSLGITFDECYLVSSTLQLHLHQATEHFYPFSVREVRSSSLCPLLSQRHHYLYFYHHDTASVSFSLGIQLISSFAFLWKKLLELSSSGFLWHLCSFPWGNCPRVAGHSRMELVSSPRGPPRAL